MPKFLSWLGAVQILRNHFGEVGCQAKVLQWLQFIERGGGGEVMHY